MNKNGYHVLLPMYLQDRLRRAVKLSSDESRFADVKYMEGIEEAIAAVKNEYPQAFLNDEVNYE